MRDAVVAEDAEVFADVIEVLVRVIRMEADFDAAEHGARPQRLWRGRFTNLGCRCHWYAARIDRWRRVTREMRLAGRAHVAGRIAHRQGVALECDRDFVAVVDGRREPCVDRAALDPRATP